MRLCKRMLEDLEQDLRDHLEMETQDNIDRGMSPQEARSAALRKFGNVARVKEETRAVWSVVWLEQLLQDVRYGARMLLRSPGLTVAVVLALALGIGMNAAVFTFVNALLLRPPQGVATTNKLVEVFLHDPKGSGVQSYLPFNYPDYAYYRDHSKSLEGLMAFDGDGQEAIWNQAGTGEIVHGQLVSGNLFSLAGVNAVVGRTLSVDDDRINNPRQVAVLSYPFWRQKLGGDPGIVGKTLMLDGAEFSVVGVAPAGFTGLMVGAAPDFWAPLTTQGRFTHEDQNRLTNRHSYWLIVAGKMRRSGDRKSVQAELQVLAKQVYVAQKSADDFQDARVYPLTLVPGPFRGYVGAFTGGLLAVFVIVLLIACTNAASLLLARATGRTREMATRSALGAGRGRLMRQMLVESLMLAGIAGTAGMAIAWTTARLLLELKPADIPITLAIPMDWRVVLFTVAVSLATGVLFGLAPALRASAVEAARVLKEESQSGDRKKARIRNALVVVQMAMCVVLLAGAALCVRSLINANAIDAGFDTHHIALARLDPGNLKYTPEKVNEFYARLLERVERLPGVISASYAEFLPLGTSRSEMSAGKQLGKDPSAIRVGVYRVEPGFFRTMGISLLRGRDLTQKEADSDKPDAVVINETLARSLWPGKNPVGEKIALGGEKEMSQVVGVVKNGKYRSLGEGPLPVVFRGTIPAARTLVVRTAGDSRTLLGEVSREVPIVDPLMVATGVQTIEEYMALPLFPARTVGWLLGVSGILAVVMTTIGLFGVIAYMVSQRTHEIGVRMALGARRVDVLKMVMSQGLRMTAIGLGIGLCAAFGAARLLSPLLYGIGANDPATMTSVAIGLGAIALTACYLPARKAMSVDPSVALRYE
ncbi:ADOP family duplicated permease [Acidicapsa dinghuensis]|uniref:ADOP family duplicated permease n=1 Tax=Acidicapsa dinghuensis TaxID=2218256 RepID=A0ABW1EFM6_9BACT|nr:ABC transporter permease [Acidicapsa dinghuensis]